MDPVALDYIMEQTDKFGRPIGVAGVVLFKEPPPGDNIEPFTVYPAPYLHEYPLAFSPPGQGDTILFGDTKRRLHWEFKVDEPYDRSGQTIWKQCKVFAICHPGKPLEDAVCEVSAMNDCYRQIRKTAGVKQYAAYHQLCGMFDANMHRNFITACKDAGTAKAAHVHKDYVHESGQVARELLPARLPFEETEAVSKARLWLLDARHNSEGSVEETTPASHESQSQGDMAMIVGDDDPFLSGSQPLTASQSQAPPASEAASESILAVQPRAGQVGPPVVQESEDMFAESQNISDAQRMPPPQTLPPLNVSQELPSPIRPRLLAPGSAAASASQPSQGAPGTSTQVPAGTAAAGGPASTPGPSKQPQVGKGKGKKGKKRRKAGPASKTVTQTDDDDDFIMESQTPSARKPTDSDVDDDDPFSSLSSQKGIKRRRRPVKPSELDSEDDTLDAEPSEKERERLPEVYYSLPTAMEKLDDLATREPDIAKHGRIIVGLTVRMHRDVIARQRLAKKRDVSLRRRMD